MKKNLIETARATLTNESSADKRIAKFHKDITAKIKIAEELIGKIQWELDSAKHSVTEFDDERFEMELEDINDDIADMNKKLKSVRLSKHNGQKF